MKIYFHAPERPEASRWAEMPAVPAEGDWVELGGFRFKVERRDWEISDEPEVTVYCTFA